MGHKVLRLVFSFTPLVWKSFKLAPWFDRHGLNSQREECRLMVFLSLWRVLQSYIQETVQSTRRRTSIAAVRPVKHSEAYELL